MENKKTTELMSRKSTLKSKLMAAVSMLLVSAIMVSVTTYAWFILSTAPEVKGMSTTVGSNGALEMALLDYAKGENETLTNILDKVTTNVGDSSAAANKKVEDSNRTWGNLVDLSGEYYGLTSSVMTLYPSALNMDTNDTTQKKISSDSMLKYAAYGTDGRVAELKSNTFAAKYDSDSLNFLGYDGYGVRAIGTGTEADPIAAGFEAAKSNYNSAVANALSVAKYSLDQYGPAMANMAVKHGLNDEATFTYKDEVVNIVNAKAGLVSAANYIKVAIQNAYSAYYLSTNSTAAPSLEISAIKTDITGNQSLNSLATLIGKYEALVTELDAISITVKITDDGQVDENATYRWAEIRDAIDKLIESDSMKINESTMDEVKNAAKKYQSDRDPNSVEYKLLQSMLKSPKVYVNGGAYCSVANFVGSYVSKEFTLQIDLLPAENATLVVGMSDTENEAYFNAVTTVVNALPDPKNAGDAKAILSTAYGYAVDLAFRSNAAGKLMLTEAVERVDGATGLQGGGATFTVTNGTDIAKLAKALRVVFIDTDTRAILGVAGMDTTPVTGQANVYALHMYSYDVSDEGIITLKDKAADDTITTLSKDTAKAISALVYVDGGNVDYAMDSVSGSLNLQFATDAELQPMNYTNYATAGLTFVGETTKATVGQTATIARPATIKVGNTTLTDAEMDKVTWKSSKTDVATVDETTGVVTVGSTAGTTDITATYTDNSGTHTGSYTLTVEQS